MEKAIYLGEDSSGYKAACEGGKDSIYFLEHLGKLVSLSWKYVQKTRETERLWRHWYRNDCKLGPKFWRMDGPVISNWKSLIIFLGDFSVLQMTKIEGMEEHGLLQMTIWMIRPPLCSSVLCKEDGPPDDQNIFLVRLGWNSHQTCPSYRGS